MSINGDRLLFVARFNYICSERKKGLRLLSQTFSKILEL